MLSIARIPYVVYGDKKLLDSKDSVNIQGYLKALLNPNDKVSFNRVIQLAPGIKYALMMFLICRNW